MCFTGNIPAISTNVNLSNAGNTVDGHYKSNHSCPITPDQSGKKGPLQRGLNFTDMTTASSSQNRRSCLWSANSQLDRVQQNKPAFNVATFCTSNEQVNYLLVTSLFEFDSCHRIFYFKENSVFGGVLY